MIRKRTKEGHTEATGRHRVENAVRCRGEKNDGEAGERTCLTKKSAKPADQKREEERVGETPMSERMAVGNACQESQCIDVRKRACDTGRGGQWRRHARRPESDGDRERNGGMRKDRRHPGILGGPIKSRSGMREAPRRHKYSLSPRERGGVRARAAIARCLLRKEVVTTYQWLTYR